MSTFPSVPMHSSMDDGVSELVLTLFPMVFFKSKYNSDAEINIIKYRLVFVAIHIDVFILDLLGLNGPSIQ
jgi:hypothetical protein